jgi:YD repeat-containing protein
MSEPRKLSDDERREAALRLISQMHARTRPPTGTRIAKADDGPPSPSTVPASQVGRSFERYFGQVALGGNTLEALLKRLEPLARSDPALASEIKAEMASSMLRARIAATRRASDPVAAVAAIRKANDPQRAAVYDAAGKLVGWIDPADRKPLVSLSAPSSAAAAAQFPGAATEADLTPAPSADAGVAANAVAKRR